MATAAKSPLEAPNDLHVANDADADAQIRAGYPVTRYAAAGRARPHGRADGRDPRSLPAYLSRYRNDNKTLGLPESERLFCYLSLLTKTDDVLGSRDKAA